MTRLRHLLFVVMVALPSVAAADDGEFLAEFTAGVEALQRGEFEDGLAHLERADGLGDDPRLIYYRGYALEKLQRCDEAKRMYRRATRQTYTDPRMQDAARDAFDGIGERCEPVEMTSVDDGRRMGTGRVGWKIFGWSASALGVLTLLTVPVKTAAEQTAAQEPEQYFAARYDCDVDLGTVSGESCDFEGLNDDEGYERYTSELQRARKTTTLLLATGAGLAGVGVLTLVIVASTRGPEKVTLGVLPNGLGLSLAGSF